MNKHLKFIDTLPCVVCGKYGCTHHHLLRVDRQYLIPTAKTSGLMFPKVKSKGMGTKSDDRFTIPLCPECHAAAHRYGNDKAYLQQHGIDNPEKLALNLFALSGECEKATDIIRWLFVGRRDV